jgi:hypothetical protein
LPNSFIGAVFGAKTAGAPRRYWGFSFAPARRNGGHLPHNAAFAILALEQCTMAHDVHLYLAVGKAASIGRYPLGEVHAVQVFVRVEAGAAFNGSLAEAVAASGGWTLTEIRNATLVNAESIKNADDAMQGAFASATRDGMAVLVYDEPIANYEPPVHED